MFVGACRLAVIIADSHSLKDKRAVVRRLKARLSERFAVPAAEVGALDRMQRAELGVAVTSADRPWIDRLFDDVARFVAAEDGVELVEVLREVGSFRGEAGRLPMRSDDDAAMIAAVTRTGAGDKAAATSGDAEEAWVPPSWRAETAEEDV